MSRAFPAYAPAAAAALVSVMSCSPMSNDMGFVERAVTVDGETYRYQVYVPGQHTTEQSWPVILFLHGGGERGTDGRLPATIGLGDAIRNDPERFPVLAVFPQVRPGRLWDHTMQRQALVALDSTIEEFRGDRERVYLTGLSIGGRGAWALAAREPDRFAALVIVAGVVMVLDRPTYTPEMRATLRQETDFIHADDPYAALAAKVRALPIWLFHGSDDPLHPAAESRQMLAALKRLDADVRYTEYTGVGHESWDRAYGEPELMAWLLAKRRSPSPQ